MPIQLVDYDDSSKPFERAVKGWLGGDGFEWAPCPGRNGLCRTMPTSASHVRAYHALDKASGEHGIPRANRRITRLPPAQPEFCRRIIRLSESTSGS